MKNMKEPHDQDQVAVALGFDRETMRAPEVLATGQGYIAKKILEIAKENRVSIKKDPVLVEALAQLDLGQQIPPELYQVVAEILVFIMETDAGHKGLKKMD